MNQTELSLFMRFVTGSSVCATQSIKVEFIALSGFSRRPISHTCNSTIELSTNYINYSDFRSEFDCILLKVNEEFVCPMTSV